MEKQDVLRLSVDDEQWQLLKAAHAKSIELFEIVGWRYNCSLLCKSGAYAAAEALSNDPTDEGWREVQCTAWNTLHSEIGSGACMQRTGECLYAITDFEWFKWSGPTPIHERPDRDHRSK